MFSLTKILKFLYMGLNRGGVVKWKELINQKKDREVKNMDLEREWEVNQEDKLLRIEEEKAEKG